MKPGIEDLWSREMEVKKDENKRQNAKERSPPGSYDFSGKKWGEQVAALGSSSSSIRHGDF